MPENEFMNSYDEIHSVWYGISDAISWTRDPRTPESEECLKEPHYYRFGYLIGGILEAAAWAILGISLGLVFGG
jgi:hypothetical protein